MTDRWRARREGTVPSDPASPGAWPPVPRVGRFPVALRPRRAVRPSDGLALPQRRLQLRPALERIGPLRGLDLGENLGDRVALGGAETLDRGLLALEAEATVRPARPAIRSPPIR
jgi:hypothetical protein